MCIRKIYSIETEEGLNMLDFCVLNDIPHRWRSNKYEFEVNVEDLE